MSTYYGTCEICQMSECGNCKDNGVTDINFLSKKVKERCNDCVCLVSGDNGEWVCDESEQLCMAVVKCPEGVEFKS